MARATAVAASITRPGGDSQYARAPRRRASGGPAMVPGGRARRRPGGRRIGFSDVVGGQGFGRWVPACQVTGRAPLRLQTLRDGLPLPTKRGKRSTHSYQGVHGNGNAAGVITTAPAGFAARLLERC